MRSDLRRLFTGVLAGGAAGGGNEINLTCPAITPVLGAEILTNPGFEGTYDDESAGGGGTVMVAPGWRKQAVETDGTDTLNESATAHGGSKSQLINVDAASEGIRHDAAVTNAIAWYQVEAWVNLTSGAAVLSTDFGLSQIITTTGSWQQAFRTGLVTSASGLFYILSSSAAANFLVDDCSVKKFDFASMTSSLLGTRTQKNGTYKAHPVVANGTQAGILLEYTDANNFLLAMVDRSGASAAAKLISRLAGTYAIQRTGTITYVAGAELKVVNNNGTFGLFYNNIQVGADVAITETALGYGVYGFSSYASNEVGIVMTSPL